jgi:KDO2-lipid IV(A) lauroyltransferase
MTIDADDIQKTPLYRFWQPRYWPLWLGLAVLRALVFLPYRAQLRVGRALGRLLFRLMPKRRHIAAVNLRLCFPELAEQERHAILRRLFESLGIGAFELGMAWWASDERVQRIVRIDGLENLQKPLREGRGVVLLSGHFSAQELTGRVIKMSVPDIAALYRPNRNAFVNELLFRGRSNTASRLIPKDAMRTMLRTLKQGLTVWYAPDQSYRRKYSALVPFFGEPAMTNAALTHIARISKAAVVPYFPRRLEDGSGYHVEILPALDRFPTDDPAGDALRVNRLLEERIRRAPDQYYWVHRRFKQRPPEFPDPYA